MHILIENIDGKKISVKKTDIRRVYELSNKRVVVCFVGNKNSPITIKESVEDFHNMYLAK